MKIVLVDPPQMFLQGHGQTRQVQPLGLGYIGAYLASHHDVRFLLPDTRSYNGDDPWGELDAVIEAEAADVVAFTAVTATYPSARYFAERIKQISPEIVTVLGGVHATSEPRSALLGAPAIDYVVMGEGEETLLELLAALERERAGRPSNLDEVRGIFYRDAEGELCSNGGRASIADVDALPFPLRENLIWPEDIHPAFYQALITLRGCPYRCIYCAVPSSNDRKTRYRSPGNVVDEIAMLKERYDVPALFFHDSVFSLHRARTVEICQTMIERGLTVPFQIQTRTDRVDPELLELMKAAGCQQIFFGIESGDADSLKKIRKKTSLDSIREAVHHVKALGIRATGFFMVGFPWETETLIQRTADFATSIDLDAISLFSATPLPGTELWDMAGGGHMPDSIDFRTPQVNLTSMNDDAYARLFETVKARVDAYNQTMMYARLEGIQAALARGETGPFPPGARVDWNQPG